MLKQLVYRSHSTDHVSEVDLEKITSDSLTFNERHNITGVLLFDGKYFFQVLEGESEYVDALFEHIKADSRHSNVMKVTEVVVHKRDFGAGYAGLSLLADFSPDKIKLDRKITTGIHESGHRQAITEAVLEFANSMGIPLVVEGVETLAEWLWLQHAGVQRFQGYLFAKPKLNGVNGIAFNI